MKRTEVDRQMDRLRAPSSAPWPWARSAAHLQGAAIAIVSRLAGAAWRRRAR